MAAKTTTTPTDGQDAMPGRVAGAVLATIRRHAGVTQEQFAERCGKSKDTVQGWESGRRPLMRLPMQDAGKLRRTLHAVHADKTLLAVLDDALRADMILAELGETDPQTHPFASAVPDRALTELVAWPMTGQAPRQLCGHAVDLVVPAGVRDQAAAGLREVVDRADDETTGPMITRQALFLLAKHEPSRDWVEGTSRRHLGQARDLTQWSARWPMARTTAVAAAVAGDLAPLERFVAEGLATDEGLAANLSYWAYWVGETRADWSTDADMLSANDWSGHKLLSSLCDGLTKAVPYRELCAHTLWALLRHHRQLASEPDIRQRVSRVVDKVTSHPGLVSVAAERRLEQVSYLMAN